jgi:serine/threonine-protein kinase RsbW
MPETVRLNIKSDPANLADARRTVEELCRRGGLDDGAVADVGLCVNEALANVMRHAYGGDRDRPIEIEVQAQGGEATVRVRDWGNGVDPTTLPPKKYDPLEPGGLGLICLRQMMDTAEFRRQPDGGMLLTMTRRNRHRPTSKQASECCDR